MAISNFDLVAGTPVTIQGIGEIRQPKLEDIRKIGFTVFYRYVNVFLMDKNFLAEDAEAIASELWTEIKIFDLLILDATLKAMLQNALSFFVCGEIMWSQKNLCFAICHEHKATGLVNRDNYDELKRTILQICFMSSQNDPEIKSIAPSKKQQALISDIEAKLAAGRKSMERAKVSENAGIELWNIIAAVAAKHQGYNLMNIWGLTLWQLYDQFSRINNEVYFNMAATRWCAWGEGEFKHDEWFVPSIDKRKEG